MSAAVAPADLVVPDHTRDAQCRAANPRASAWVSANAGAGKTKVLTDRVVRLLLTGAPPGRILCLTFTKAAAANMAIRVFERLGRWVTLDAESLSAELTELEGEAPSRTHLRRARRLFARAVETPGGLKIDTIHAFCERLLQLAPFEANVPARFAVLDENQSEELIAQATANVLASARLGGGAIADALDRVGADASGEALAAVLGAALRERPCDDEPALSDASLARLRNLFGVSPEDTIEGIERAMTRDGLAPERCRAVADALDHGKANDRKCAAALRDYVAGGETAGARKLYLQVFFTDSNTPRAGGHLCTKSIAAATRQELLAEQERLAILCDRLRALEAIERTGALFALAKAVRADVERTKARLGALDFKDLIDKTVALLSRGDAQWVLYKLDRGIDHVLVDEAQDTNPEQWEILRRITEDFTAGRGAGADRVRTLFAVGDPKQSIYSFQGAAPRQFAETRRLWRTKVRQAELAFEDVQLTLSFRSGPAVLSAVDATFRLPENFRGLSFEDDVVGTVHESARPDAPGLVELWPTAIAAAEREPDAWTLPLDELEADSPPVATARRVAQTVRNWTVQGDEHGQVWSPGEVLILVRKRGAAFEAVIRALKEAGVPVAGADRLDIGEHIAVLDLVAAGRAALLEADDLTLAIALKSPLVGLGDEDLQRIGMGRGPQECLAGALRRHAGAGDAAARAGCEALASWQRLARTKGAFGFFATLLGPHGGRSKLVARLGSEAGDAIDAFLCFAHSAELVETPSLTTFLERFASASHTIKRDLDATRDEVRVMTVHGAKGLEASLVILIDGCEVLGRDPPLVPVPDGRGGSIPVWSPGKNADCLALAAARSALRAKGLEEHHRLLYVAMTRAKDRLVIAPYLSGRRDSPGEAWCEMVRRGLGAVLGGELPVGGALRWRAGTPAPVALPAAVTTIAPVEVPDWLIRAVDPEPEPAPPLRPSGALGAADRDARPGDGPFAPQARLRGTLIHALLERLPGIPAESRERAARAYVAIRAPRLAPERQTEMVGAALAVLEGAALGRLFGPASRAEVSIAGRIDTPAGPVPVSGQIDRLAVLKDEVLFADFKTTVRPPGPEEPAPAAHVGQLALYRTLLQDIYPGRNVRAFLVFTSGPEIRELKPAELDRALVAVRSSLG